MAAVAVVAAAADGCSEGRSARIQPSCVDGVCVRHVRSLSPAHPNIHPSYTLRWPYSGERWESREVSYTNNTWADGFCLLICCSCSTAASAVPHHHRQQPTLIAAAFLYLYGSATHRRPSLLVLGKSWLQIDGPDKHPSGSEEYKNVIK